MVLGFMSLMLNVTEGEVSKICIPTKYANRMLPCYRTITLLDGENNDDDHDNNFFHCSSKVFPSPFIFYHHFSVLVFKTKVLITTRRIIPQLCMLFYQTHNFAKF